MSRRKDGIPAPSVMVVFGGTGDLARRKVLPALYALYAGGSVPNGCYVLGIARDAHLDDAGYRAMAVEAVVSAEQASRDDVAAWAERFLHYRTTPESSAEDFAALRASLDGLDATAGAPLERVFYLALPPAAFGPTIQRLGEAGLAGGDRPARLIVEKPFGHDLESARALNALIHKWFDEGQVYRIDHYLGKETVQNLLVFRFANALFETLWRRDHVDSVTITVAETLGVEGRAAFYEKAGALRDIVQNHLTQLLTLVAMEVPTALDADAIRAEKVKVLRSIRPLTSDDVVFGQYARGTVEGEEEPGYQEEPGVAKGSTTETYVALQLSVDNWRWQGVPFVLRTGKRMPRRLTEIEVKFRRAPVWLFHQACEDTLHRNALVVRLQPDEGFSLYFQVKAPGSPFHLRRLPLHFEYAEEFAALPEAYQTLLLDVLQGDQTLFVHADEVEEAWKLYAPLLDTGRPPLPYAAGTWGPAPEAGGMKILPPLDESVDGDGARRDGKPPARARRELAGAPTAAGD